jgi:hypothetical protein
MSFNQICLAKDAGWLAGRQGFCKTKMAEIQPSGGDERFLRGPFGIMATTDAGAPSRARFQFAAPPCSDTQKKCLAGDASPPLRQ